MPENRLTIATEDPVGAGNELRELQLSLTEHKSCMVGKANEVLGCKHARLCRFPWRFQDYVPGTLKGGPRNVGVYRVSASSGRSFVKLMPCWRYMEHADEWKQNGDRVRVVGVEGESVPVNGTAEKAIGKDRNGKAIIQVQKTKDLTVIPAFPRPKTIFVDRLLDLEVEEMLEKRQQYDVAGELLDGSEGPVFTKMPAADV